MSRQWKWMFVKGREEDEVMLSITSVADSLPAAIAEANEGLQTFFEDMERFQPENRVGITIDLFSYGHVASVSCPDCGADVTRLADQTPLALAEQMASECVCPADDEEGAGDAEG